MPSEVITGLLPWWVNSTIRNAIKPFPPESGNPCFVLSQMTILYTLTECHQSRCLFYLLKHLLEDNGQGDHFYQGKRKTQQILDHKISEQEEHVVIPSVMYCLSFKSLPFTQLSHINTIKNNNIIIIGIWHYPNIELIQGQLHSSPIQ